MFYRTCANEEMKRGKTSEDATQRRTDTMEVIVCTRLFVLFLEIRPSQKTQPLNRTLPSVNELQVPVAGTERRGITVLIASEAERARGGAFVLPQKMSHTGSLHQEQCELRGHWACIHRQTNKMQLDTDQGKTKRCQVP